MVVAVHAARGIFSFILINCSLLVYTAKLLGSLDASKCSIPRENTEANPPLANN